MIEEQVRNFITENFLFGEEKKSLIQTPFWRMG